MAISDKLQTQFNELTQTQRAVQVKAKLQNIRSEIIRTNSEIQEIADAGALNLLDTEIKKTLNSAWNILKQAEAAFEDVNIKELLDWRP